MKYRLKKQQDTPLSDFGYGEMLGVFEGMAFELDEYFEPVVSNVAVFGDIGPELDEYFGRESEHTTSLQTQIGLINDKIEWIIDYMKGLDK